MRTRRGVAFLLISGLLLIIIYHLSLNNQYHGKENTKLKRGRDYIDHPVYDAPRPSPTRVTEKPRINVFDKISTKPETGTPCVGLQTFNGQTPICIFDSAVDKMISSYVKDYGTWEPDLLNETGIVLQQMPQLIFVDIGCNIGTFTLFSAKLGNRVIAVDILEPALQLLQRSLTLGKLKQNVTLLLNAISDRRESVKVRFVEENPGGSYIEHNRTGDVHAILLDDLLSIINTGSVFLKLDIEGNELKALASGGRFFQILDVRYILMEWLFHKHSQTGKDIIQFLVRNGMLPFENLSKNLPLDLKRPYFWPDNIFWIKR